MQHRAKSIVDIQQDNTIMVYQREIIELQKDRIARLEADVEKLKSDLQKIQLDIFAQKSADKQPWEWPVTQPKPWYEQPHWYGPIVCGRNNAL